MAEILEKMKAADAIVLASPMYYFTWTGLISLMMPELDDSVASFREIRDFVSRQMR